MFNYCIQVQQPSSVNYNTSSFPSGSYLEKRPFMYINIFWTLMPFIIIFYLLEVLRTKRKYSRVTLTQSSSNSPDNNSQVKLPAYSVNNQNEDKKLLVA